MTEIKTSRLQPAEISANNKMARAVWSVVYLFLFRPSPRIFHFWRAFLLRCFGAKIGSAVRIYPSVRIWAPWNLTMRDGSCLGEYVDCYCVTGIVLQKNAVVSQYSFLCAASRDISSLDKPLMVGAITIGENAWVAADAFVGPGVSIGEGAVVSARASVFKDVQAWAVVAGNPAVFIKQRVVKDQKKV